MLYWQPVNLPKCESKLELMLLELSDLNSSNLTSVNETLQWVLESGIVRCDHATMLVVKWLVGEA
jgi:hypothetical protein